MQKLILKDGLMDLNTFINENRKHWNKGREAKETETEFVRYSAKQQKIKPIGTTPLIVYHWYCRNKMKDKDNVAFSKKFINDGLQAAGVLKGDGWNCIGAFKDIFYVDTTKPRVEVDIYEYGDSKYQPGSEKELEAYEWE